METDVVTILMDILNTGALVAAVILFALGKIRSTKMVDQEIERLMKYGNDQMHALAKEILEGMEEKFKTAMLEALQQFHNGDK